MPGAIKAGGVYTEIRAKIDKLSRDLAMAHRETVGYSKKMQGSLDRLNFDRASNSLQRFQKLLLVGFAGYGIKNLADSFIDTASSFEQMRVKLEALEGARGTRLFEELNKMALELPVSTQKVVQSFVTMQAMGLEPTRRQMLILADTAAVLGDDVFDRIVLQLGQMSAKGKIMAQDLNILAEAGINARGILYDTFGMTVEQLQQSNIEINKVIEALFTGMEQKFGGSTEKIMNTWRGVTELMKSQWIEIERTIADAGAFELLEEQIKSIADAMRIWLENNRELIKQEVPRYVDRVRTAIETVKGQFEGLWKILTYDPDIIEYGLIGLLIGGKKGFMLAGGAAHLLKIPGMLGEASAYAAKGYIKFSDVVAADYKELEALVEKGRKLASGWKPENIPMASAHGGDMAWAHGIKRQLADTSEYADGWRRRWDDEWKTWGVRTPTFGMAKGAEDIEKELAKIEAAEKKALQKHKEMIEEYAQTAGVSFTIKVGVDEKDFKEWQESIPDVYSIETQRAKSYTQSLENAQKAAEEFEQRNIELWNNPQIFGQTEETFDALIALSEHTAAAMQQNFSDLFFDAMTGKLKSLEDYAKAIFQSIQRAFADMAGQMAAQQLFGQNFQGGGLISSLADFMSSMFGGSTETGMGTNFTSKFLAMVKHSGGGYSSGGPARRVPSGVFSFAPRLHSGLMPDEFPAILQKGETVLPKNSHTANNITINIAAPQGRIDRESLSQMQSSLFATLERSARRNT